MHLVNEDLSKDPEKAAAVVAERVKVADPLSPRFVATTDNPEETPRGFGRSNPFEMKESAQQKTQKDHYKDELQKQIEERRRQDAIKREKMKIEEEKEERRLQEQNRKMQEEFEREKQKQQEKIEMQKRKNEEIQRALEEKRTEDERRRREEQEKRDEERRKQQERELNEKLRRTASPPIHPANNFDEQPIQNKAQDTYRAESQTLPKHVQAVISSTPPLPSKPQINPASRTVQQPVRQDKSRESKRISRELSVVATKRGDRGSATLTRSATTAAAFSGSLLKSSFTKCICRRSVMRLPWTSLMGAPPPPLPQGS
jgi:centrosome and spindle pole-associated protein 1